MSLQLSKEKFLTLIKRYTGPKANCFKPEYEEYCTVETSTIQIKTLNMLNHYLLVID